MTNQVEISREIAQRAHEGQTYGRDNQQPYFDAHVELVADRVRRAGFLEPFVAVAYLHDVVEDTEVTLEDLANAGLSRAIVSGVDAMTHREGESYMQYLFRLVESGNTYAWVVKYQDMLQNISCNPTPKQVTKYTMGMDFLKLMVGNKINLEKWVR